MRPFPDNVSVRLRPAREADVAQMAAIEAVAFSDPWPAPAFTNLLTMPYARLTVAERRGSSDRPPRPVHDDAYELIGYCIVVVAADEGEVANIAVRPAERGTGVGARLLDGALASARSDGVTQLFLEVRASNESAKCLYYSRGFERVGIRRGYYRDPVEDALVLRWLAANESDNTSGSDLR
jgi:ribosomal-protein-alanine N-acetyltransferase